MALAYLLCPTFQIENTAGKPATGGWLEVYVAGSRTKYYCASDFDGTLHPFRIPLDSLGSNIVLADDAGTYDVYVYNRYGGEMMSRYNVKAGSGGGIGSITSTDGSIIITPTENGLDLRMNSEAPSILRATAQTLSGDGQFQFSELQRDGQDAVVDTNGRVMVNEGWWHYDATVRLRWPGDPNVNGTQSISLYTANASDSTSFDLSYAHSDTVQVNGEFKAESDGTQFILGVTGVQPGMTVELVDYGIHSIIGEGAGGKYDAGTGIDIDEPNRVISVDFDDVQAKLTAGTGITIDENNVISATEAEIYTVDYTGGQPVEGTALFDEAYAAYQSGKTLILNWVNANRRGICIGYYSAYGLMFAVETVNLIGTQSDAATSGHIQYIWLYSYGTESRWRNSSLRLLPRSYAEDAGKVLMVDPENPTSKPIWQELPAQQQADWTQSDSTAADYIKNKPTVDQTYDASSTNAQSGVAVAEALATIDPADFFVATYNVTTFADILAAYNAGKTIVCTETEGPLDGRIIKYANCYYIGTYNDQAKRFAFDRVGSDDGALLSSWYYECDFDRGWRKVEFSTQPYTSAEKTKLSGIEAGAEVNVQANWNESDSSSDSFIQNKPTIPSGSQLVPSATPSDAGEVLTVDPNGDPTWAPAQAPISAGNGIDITNNVVSAKVDGTSVTFNASGELETIAAPQVQSDWAEADPADVSFIQNKPGQTSLVAGSNITIVDDAQNNTVTISAATVNVPVQDVTIDNVSVVNAQGVAEIPRQVNADWNSSAGASEILNKPSIPVIGTVTL